MVAAGDLRATSGGVLQDYSMAMQIRGVTTLFLDHDDGGVKNTLTACHIYWNGAFQRVLRARITPASRSAVPRYRASRFSRIPMDTDNMSIRASVVLIDGTRRFDSSALTVRLLHRRHCEGAAAQRHKKSRSCTEDNGIESARFRSTGRQDCPEYGVLRFSDGELKDLTQRPAEPPAAYRELTARASFRDHRDTHTGLIFTSGHWRPRAQAQHYAIERTHRFPGGRLSVSRAGCPLPGPPSSSNGVNFSVFCAQSDCALGIFK